MRFFRGTTIYIFETRQANAIIGWATVNGTETQSETAEHSTKGVVLAGGRGTRLRPFSYATTKHLVPLANKPLLEYIIENLKAAGITEIGIVIGNPSADVVRSYVGDGSRFGVDVTYIHQGEPLGLAHAVGCAEPFVGDDPFVVYFGDTIVDVDVMGRLVNRFDPAKHAAALPLQEVDEPSRFGVVEMADGEIVRIHEKPDDPPSNLAYMGVLALTPVIFEYIDGLEPSDRGELELTDALDALVGGGEPIEYHVEDGLWKDVGTPPDVVETNRILLEERERRIDGTVEEGATVTGRVVLEPGAVVESGSTVRGPAAIGANTRIERGASVGPYASIGEGCTVAKASVESSVVFDDVTVRKDEYVVDSILGSGVELTNGSTEEGTQYVLGYDARRVD